MLEYIFVFVWYILLLSPFFTHMGVSLKLIFGIDIEYLNHLNGLSLYIQSLIAIFIILTAALLFFRRKNTNSFIKKFRRIVYLTLPGSIVYLFIQNYLIALEVAKYPNFLYSHTGFAIENIQFTGIFCAVYVLISISLMLYSYAHKYQIFENKNAVNVKFPIIDKLDLKVLIFGLVFILYYSVSSFLSFGKILSESKKSYSYVLGNQYKYIVALSEITPSDSVIIHPPQSSKWPAIGNQVVLRYFLFPRTLVSGALVDSNFQTQDINGAYFVEINPGSNTSWPTITSKTVTFDEKNEIFFKRLILVSDKDQIMVFRVYF